MYAEHRLDIFDAHLYLATSRKDWRDLRKSLPWLDKQPTSAGLTHCKVWAPKRETAYPVVALWLEMKRLADTAERVNIIAHEATHAASEILGWAGHEKAGDEPHAYLVGWLSRWMWENCGGDGS